jgi:phage terminase small subunit
VAGLTPKQEAFALAFFETGNAAEAYRRSYDVPADRRDSWVYVEASQMLDNPKITQRVEELQAQAAKLSLFTVAKAAEEYEAARSLAMSSGAPSAAVAAVAGKVKLFGLEMPTRSKHELTGKNGGPIETDVNHKGEIGLSATASFLAEALAGGCGQASGELGEE